MRQQAHVRSLSYRVLYVPCGLFGARSVAKSRARSAVSDYMRAAQAEFRLGIIRDQRPIVSRHTDGPPPVKEQRLQAFASSQDKTDVKVEQ